MKTHSSILLCIILLISQKTIAQPLVCEVVNKYRNAQSLQFSIIVKEWSELHDKMMNWSNYMQVNQKYYDKKGLLNKSDVTILDNDLSLLIRIPVDSLYYYYSSCYLIDSMEKNEYWNKSNYLKNFSFPANTGELLFYTPLEELMFKKRHLKKKLKPHPSGYIFDMRNATRGDKMRLFVNKNTLFIDSIEIKGKKYPHSIHFDYFGYNGLELKASKVFPIDKSNEYLQAIFNDRLQESIIEAQQKDSIRTNFNPAGEFEKLTLIDFWFIGCQPCHRSFPAIEKVRQTYSDSQLDIKAITFNKQKDADNYKAKFGFTFDMLYDTNNYTTKFDIKSYPTKILITPEGDILYKSFGSKLKVDEYQIIKDIIDEYLKTKN